VPRSSGVSRVMIATRTEAIFQDFFETIERQGYSLEKYLESTGLTSDQLRADLEREAAARVRDELALDALAREVGLTVTDEEIDAEINLMAISQETSEIVFRQRLKANGAGPMVAEGLVTRKAVRWLMDNVEIVEAEPDAAGDAKPAKKAAKKTPAKKAAPKKVSSAKTEPGSDDAGAKEE
jgi:trigger factor